MERDFETLKEEIKKHLDSSRQNWLFGAGISFNANIPLMFPLTRRVEAIIEEKGEEIDKKLFKAVVDELDDSCHIEHYLSHLGDLITLSERSKSKKCYVGKKEYEKCQFIQLYNLILISISLTVRYGYKQCSETETIGSAENPIVEINDHLNFVRAIRSNRSNLLSRSKLLFFTTNYDTLLEDALGLERITVIDGFSGGSIAYWNPLKEFSERLDLTNKCLVYKLHGSVDWQRNENGVLFKVRYGANYLKNGSDIMIYPQATKYVETQKDPFFYLFNGFRNALNYNEDNILVTCGYSFGDNHINNEIEAALTREGNRTTLVAFSEESPTGLNPILEGWVTSSNFGNRVYVAGKKGIYYESIHPVIPPSGQDLLWWTFSGLTNFILTGDHD